MNRKELEVTLINNKMMEHDADTLQQRSDKLDEAGQAIAGKYLDEKKENDEDFLPPEYFDDAVKYATDLLYATGVPVYNKDDIIKVIENQIGWAKFNNDDQWLPDDTQKQDVVAELIKVGSYLSDADEELAYKPHVDGRPHETLDSYDTDYNKFGMIILKRQ
ncbi:MAG: hypothetical protein JWO55_471 [Candidatus Saccharibacteria bacterium]|jgi:hypothetical protein|nr:hypothetical protein [Candidatus Saccharibacteria bacterium]